MTKQEAAIKYITENYLQFNRLRYDVVAEKLQVRCAHLLGDEAKGYEASRHEYWREMTKHDINSIVCHAAQEYDTNITSREVLTALHSDLIPHVHPLREYILSLRPYTPDQPDWIDFVASQVRVAENGSDIDRTRGAVDRAEPCRSAAPVDGRSAVPVDGRSALPVDGRSAAPEDGRSAVPEDGRSAVPVDGRSAVPVDGRSAAPVDGLFSTASTTSDPQQRDPQCSASETIYSEQRERSKADALWRGCFKKWFVAMVASWMKDEVVNHQVLVLIGKQGIYKTTWLEHLIPPELRAYACKLANSNELSKDERLRIAEFGLISLDEIDSMNNRELNQLKSIITSSDVNERAAYAYSKERRIRLASFCASGNRREFLTDLTGNRRWLPFEVESIQNPFYTTLPYEQMYAEAWALAQDPTFSYWFELDEIEVLEQHNQYFRDESNEEQLLNVYFAIPATDAINAKFLTTAEISEKLVSAGNIKRPMTLNRLGMLLRQKGFTANRQGCPARRGWIVYERDSEEINAERKLFARSKLADLADLF